MKIDRVHVDLAIWTETVCFGLLFRVMMNPLYVYISFGEAIFTGEIMNA